MKPAPALFAALALLVAAPAAGSEPGADEIHLRIQIPYLGAQVPVGFQVAGAELGWVHDGVELDVGGAWGHWLLSSGARAFAMGGIPWTPYDGRDARGVGSTLRLPTLAGLEYIDSEWFCGDGYCAGDISGLVLDVHAGVEYIYWGADLGVNLRLLASYGLPLWGSAQDDFRSYDFAEQADLFGLAARLTVGVSL